MQVACKMRTNIYKKEILKVISNNHLLTISEINKHIPNANYSTIFRNVENLISDGMIKKVLVKNKKVAYEIAKNDHDHFICNKCGTVECINVPYKLIKGRKVEEITIRGICNNCITI